MKKIIISKSVNDKGTVLSVNNKIVFFENKKNKNDLYSLFDFTTKLISAVTGDEVSKCQKTSCKPMFEMTVDAPLNLELVFIDETKVSDSYYYGTLFLNGQPLTSENEDGINSDFSIKQIAENLSSALECELLAPLLKQVQLAEYIARKESRMEEFLARDRADCYLSDFTCGYDDLDLIEAAKMCSLI